MDFPSLLSILLITTLFTSLLSWVYNLPVKKFKNKSRPRLPPGPAPLPLLGSVIPMLRNKPTFRWIDRLMDEMHTRILCLRLGNVHVIVVNSPEIAREFLKKEDATFASRPDFMSTHLASGGYLTTILVPYGDQWKKMRDVIVKVVLSTTRHKWLQHKRDEEADNLLRYVYNQCQNISVTKGVVNVRIACEQYAANVTRNMTFGRRYFGNAKEDGGPGEEEFDHVAAVFEIFRHLYAFCVTDYLPWLRWITDFDGHEKMMRNAIQRVRKYQDPLVDQRIQQWKEGVRQKEEDLLDVLIRLDDPVLTADEIKAQIVELMLATLDNPSNCVEWVISEMINKPQTLKLAMEELDRVVGKERLVQESDLPNLNYIKACAKEGYRLHPTAPFNVPHVSISDITVAGYFIPKGSHVLLSRQGLGRNPEAWEDAMSFVPERHLADGSGNMKVVLTDSELRMLSFSTGRRGCPGAVLGTTMTIMLLARLLQGFTWELPPTEQRIDLSECHDSLAKAKPLFALAKPRLDEHLYPKSLRDHGHMASN